MAKKKRALKPRELAAEARATANAVHTLACFEAGRIVPKEDVAEQTLEGLRALEAPTEVLRLLDDESNEDRPPIDPYDRVQRFLGALDARARQSAKGRCRPAAAGTRAMLARLTTQFPDWKSEVLTEKYLGGMRRFLEAVGFRPAPKIPALRQMLNREKRRRRIA